MSAGGRVSDPGTPGEGLRGGDLRGSVLSTDAPLHVVEVGPGEPPDGPDGAAVDAGTDLVSGPRPRDPRAATAHARTFLLLHGYGCSSYVWSNWVDALAARGRVLLVDMKGFGAAPKPDDDRYSPDDLAGAVLELIRERDLRHLTLVGHSLGGGVALLTASALRDEGAGRLDRMILVAAAAYPQRLPPLVWLSHRPRTSSALMRLIGPRRVIRWVARSVVHDPARVTEDQVREYARAWETPEGRRAAMAAGRQILPPDLEERSRRYRELDVPVLLLWGDHERVIPLWVGKRLEREMPDARLVVLGSCGHVPMDERPEASLRVVERFLDR